MDRWDPFEEFVRLRNLFNELFDRTFQKQVMDDDPGVDSWHPTIDVYENDQEVVIEAELPGVGTDQIKIEFGDGVLTIKGDMQAPFQAGEAVFHRIERRRGRFRREIKIPFMVDEANIEAVYRAGLLTVVLPRGTTKQIKTIPITSSH